MKKNWFPLFLIGIALVIALFFCPNMDQMVAYAKPIPLTATGSMPGYPTGISLNKSSLKLERYKSEKLTAYLSGSNIRYNTVYWGTYNSNVATVDGNGNVTARGKGSTTITAKTVNGYVAYCNVTVTIVPTGIGVLPDSLELDRGEAKQLSVTVVPSDASDKRVTFTSTNATVATVDSNGWVTGKNNGQCSIKVTTVNGLSQYVPITVIVKPNGIGLHEDRLSLEKGQQFQLNATVVPVDARDKTLYWSSSNTKVAIVDGAGNITAIGPGKCNITARSVANSSLVSSPCEVTVKVSPKYIWLNDFEVTTYVGQRYKLTAYMEPTDVTEKTLTWTTSNQKVAAVDVNGYVIPNAPGKCTITVKTVNNLTASCDVMVLIDNDSNNPFADIKSNGGTNWQYKAAMYVVQNKYMVGKGELAGRTLFGPNERITRCQFVQSLYNVAGRPSVSYHYKFVDVPNGKWYSLPITWAVDKNITSGKGDLFDIDGPATRQELATFFYHYAQSEGYDVSIVPGKGKRITDFSDGSSVANWAITPMNWALSMGIMTGKGTELDPLGTATRAECATMIKNFVTAYENAPKLTIYFEEDAADGIEEEEVVIDEVVIDEEVIDEEVVDEEVIDEEVVDEEVVDEEVVDEEVIDEEVIDEEVVDEEVVDEEVVDEEVVDEEVTDEEVVDEVSVEETLDEAVEIAE